MDFPAWVPAGARAHISRTLGGDGGNWKGVNAFVTEYRAKGNAGDALAGLECEQACYQRFAHDARMHDVYAELGKVFTSDNQYGDFLRSANGADQNFAPYRERLKQAKNLASKISAAARELARLIEQAGKAGGGMAPSEFYSIRTLLDATDNHELDDHNLSMWQSVREVITGTMSAPAATQAPAECDDSAPRQTIIVDEENAEEARLNNPDACLVVLFTGKSGKAKIDPKDEARNMLGYAWGVAPHLPALLGTVARSADAWIPQESGAIGAAISTRQRNSLMEYVRAFAELLRQNMPGLDLSASIYAAIAGTADVVLNDANSVVTADAVRKALIRAVDNSD
jgi:hypothetical protein